MLLLSTLSLFLGLIYNANAYWQIPSSGYASMTHYSIPLNDIAACGCTGESTHYPTAAMSSLAYGSTSQYGPACGMCFKLTLLNTFTSNPPFFPDTNPSIVIKVTDECPAISEWCNATATQPNPAGHIINFDLAYPNPAGAIPSSFFPSNITEYGYTDFGVWNISYETTSCTTWEGWSDPSALGSVTDLGDSVCCPADVTGNNTCPSFSENAGTPPPDTGSAVASNLPHMSRAGEIAIGVIVILVGLLVLGLGSYYTYLLLNSRRQGGKPTSRPMTSKGNTRSAAAEIKPVAVAAKAKSGTSAAKGKPKTQAIGKGKPKSKISTKQTV